VKLTKVSGHRDFMKVYSNLKDDFLKHRVEEAMDSLQQDVTRGEKIEKKLWPNKYKTQGITNLFRYEITTRNFRLIYTIRSTPNTIDCQLLDFVNHKKYNKIFGYSG
jgi:hypothetical protein